MISTGANRRGIVALVTGMAAFTVNDALVKFVARAYPFGEVIFVRGAMAIVLVGAIVAARGHLTHVRAAVSGRSGLPSMTRPSGRGKSSLGKPSASNEACMAAGQILPAVNVLSACFIG